MKFKKDYVIGEEIDIHIDGINEDVTFTVVNMRKEPQTGKKIYTLGCNPVVAVTMWYYDDGNGDPIIDTWGNSYLRKWLHDDFYLRLPKEVRFILVGRGSKSYSCDGSLHIDEDKVWVPSLDELGYKNSSITNDKVNEGSTFDFFKDDDNKLARNKWFNKYLTTTGIECHMWTRSQIIPNGPVFTIKRPDELERAVGVSPFFDIRP